MDLILLVLPSLMLPDRFFSFIWGREKGPGEQPLPFLFYRSEVVWVVNQ